MAEGKLTGSSKAGFVRLYSTKKHYRSEEERHRSRFQDRNSTDQLTLWVSQLLRDPVQRSPSEEI